MSNVSRRGFLKSALALSAIPLVSMAQEKKQESLKFMHITDIHMDLQDSDSVDSVELLVAFINREYKDLDFVLFGGDNFNNNASLNSDALKFKEIVAGLHCPYYAIRGNKEASPHGDTHINLAEFKEMFFDKKGLQVAGKDWLLRVKGYNILGLDSNIENHNNGAYTKETLSFAETALEQNKPTVILNHHPYTNYWGGTTQKDITKYVIKDTKEIQEKLFKYDNLLMTLSGHKHIDSVKEIQETKVVVTRGYVRPLDLDMYPMRYIELNGNDINEKLIYTS